MQPVLSVLVISFNQRDLLNRCFQSLLNQKIRVPWEIVLSDALSHDGTYELAEEYAAKFNTLAEKPNKDGFYSPEFVPVHCDTDEGNCVNRTQCCGWMKLTAYLHARGTYMVNMDADDYLLHDDIYQLQIDMLESHPECSMCQQHVLQLPDGAAPETGLIWPQSPKMITGAILSPEDVIVDGLRGLNQTYMIRRHPEDDMRTLYGNLYDDTIITLHHLQYGPIVFVDRADYVWVQYKKSISHSIQGDDHLAENALLPIHHIHYLPKFANLFMREAMPKLVHLFKELAAKHYHLQLTEATVNAFRQTNGYIYEALCRETPTLWDQIKLRYIRLVLLLTSKFKLHNERYIYKLLVK